MKIRYPVEKSGHIRRHSVLLVYQSLLTNFKYRLKPPLTLKPSLSHILRHTAAMQNRRNFYRILQVQPDAPAAVIKNNYRTLLQKLRLHPDLGGDQTDASLVNQAWQTLRDPTRRRSYDKQLLQDYQIQILSQGHLAGRPNKCQAHTHSADVNQRNYYRILNIQADASSTIINASYRHQLKNPHAPIELLQEAYAVLGNPEKRRIYNNFLKNYCHINALKKKKDVKGKSLVIAKNIISQTPAPPILPTHPSNTYYQPIIIHYCNFCKTPHSNHYLDYRSACCIECNSPLYEMTEIQHQQLQRTLSRIDWHGNLTIYTDWPGQGHCATLINLSPGGLGLITAQPLQPGQIIKVDGEHFKCVAKVMHCRHCVTGNAIGICFITVLFDRKQGTFVSTQA